MCRLPSGVPCNNHELCSGWISKEHEVVPDSLTGTKITTDFTCHDMIIYNSMYPERKLPAGHRDVMDTGYKVENKLPKTGERCSLCRAVPEYYRYIYSIEQEDDDVEDDTAARDDPNAKGKGKAKDEGEISGNKQPRPPLEERKRRLEESDRIRRKMWKDYVGGKRAARSKAIDFLQREARDIREWHYAREAESREAEAREAKARADNAASGS